MIDINKKYKTRGGTPARVLCVDAKHGYPVIGLVEFSTNYSVVCYTKEGKISTSEESQYDLIEESFFDSFKVDDLCVVWNDGQEKKFRYFYKEKNSKPHCFDCGETSYTNCGRTSPWDYCRKATSEEIATKTIKD